MALTQTEKEQLAVSNEMKSLYQALAATQSAVFKRIQQEVDNPSISYDAPTLKGIVIQLTKDLNNLLPSLLDSGNCNKGEHWDAALGQCVPD